MLFYRLPLWVSREQSRPPLRVGRAVRANLMRLLGCISFTHRCNSGKGHICDSFASVVGELA